MTSKRMPDAWFPAAVRSPRQHVPLTTSAPTVPINRRITIRTTDHPRTDRHVSITTRHRNFKPIYVVGVVDGFGHYARDYPTPREFETPDEARQYANQLLKKERA